ncbi:phosphatase PAP2 family protein, partial [Saccharopolyspora sp. NPDC002686]|uniref:phosphatase PAP2 family protein n=1 Tax=Saccharopolyspora sp. NPDC002686 TaxID=3154541 RepID=UPI00332E6689
MVQAGRTPAGAGNPDNAGGVPDISAELYRDVVGFAAGTPEWVQSFAAFFTEAALVLLFGFLLLSCWRARRMPARSMAIALLGVVAVGVAYALSEILKSLIQENRPCRAMHVTTIVECPAPGDWSFPSNHSVISGAAAIGVLVAWRKLGIPALLLAMGAAFSRVFVGAHYPHDALVGLLFGALVSAVMELSWDLCTPQERTLWQRLSVFAGGFTLEA